MIETCDIALKEWSVACRALEEGRQILLLRKGGLLDSEGIFELEYSHFWLMPTGWHQDANLLKPAHHDLLQNDIKPQREELRFSAWAEVARVWSLDACRADAESILGRLEHIWSARYLDVRLGYKPEKPVLIVALRVHVLPSPQIASSHPEYFGCKSWVELEKPLSTNLSTPALNDADFEKQLAAATHVLGI